MTMDNLRIALRIVFYEEDNEWVAHCLEFDLVGVGPDKQSAIKQLADAIFVQASATLKSKNLKNLFRPADGEYLRRFAAGVDIAAAELAFEIKSPKKVTFERTEARIWRPTPPSPARKPRRARVVA